MIRLDNNFLPLFVDNLLKNIPLLLLSAVMFIQGSSNPNYINLVHYFFDWILPDKFFAISLLNERFFRFSIGGLKRWSQEKFASNFH